MNKRTAAIINSQTAKGAQKGAGLVLRRRSGHETRVASGILVDTLGRLSNVVVHGDGAFHLLRRARRLFPFIERYWCLELANR